MRRLIHLTRVVAASAILLGLSASPAAAVTIKDLLNLKAAGLSDDILIALIQTDNSVFYLTADDIIALSKQGMSERVILVMIDTARRQQLAQQPCNPALDPPADQTTSDPATSGSSGVPQVTERVIVVEPEIVPVPVPVAVPVVVKDRDRDRDGDRDRPSRSEPVYWGYGGQRRPDSWPATPTTPPPPTPARRGGS